MDPEEAAGLAARAAAGDADAWRLLVGHFSGLVWSIARARGLSSADAADVTQTTWLRLMQHLRRIEDPERIGAWLATTARREAQRVARDGRRVTAVGDQDVLQRDDLVERSAEQEMLDAQAAARDVERGRQIWQVLEAQPARCRELLRVLMASPPPAYSEVAAALDMRIGSIGPTRARCLRQLRKELARRGISGRLAPS